MPHRAWKRVIIGALCVAVLVVISLLVAARPLAESGPLAPSHTTSSQLALLPRRRAPVGVIGNRSAADHSAQTLPQDQPIIGEAIQFDVSKLGGTPFVAGSINGTIYHLFLPLVLR